MTIVQNAAASHDMEKHILPFISHCSEMEFITSPVKFSMYHNPEGHNGLPSKKDTIAFIHQALSAWDSVEHQQGQE